MSHNLDSIADRVDTAMVYPLAKRTHLQTIGNNIWLKREDQQDVFSFKIRGAANRIFKLSAAEKARGVVCASAGNHAQGVALAASDSGIKSTIFMPVTTPDIKTEAVTELGGEIRLIGDSYDAAYAAAQEFAEKTGAVFIHAFDDPDVIAGQGSVAKEILAQLPNPAAVYIGVGGGGLLAGIGAYLRVHSPHTKIIAVEPEGAASLKISLEAGEPTSLESVDGFADGVAVKRIGTTTFELAQKIAPQSILVSNDEICATVKTIFEKTRTVVEPAGALALAGLMKDQSRPDGPCVAIVSGANVNFDRIGHMVERAELGAGQEILFSATLPEKPGSFLKFCEALGDHAVSEFNYRYADQAQAHVLVGIKIKTPEQGTQVMDNIRAAGMEVTDLSHNRLAKEHLRHMVGGISSARTTEHIYSFEFPERPGALRDFLTALDGRWNISLFHYRNHGASSGQVLCGFQTPDGNEEELQASLQSTGFTMCNETNNPAYQMFLKA
ncbi:threonine ammonia-lyase, biosynthetic [bacterium AH-315-J23]|nr:threonine ammonia-lyase, biosynthetic [bacterium AH-315-J23]PHQ67772.1 MAG: threonine ammonia-lyase, biosynthetic [Robiginitomaculum sp.]